MKINYKAIIKILGMLTLIEGLFMFPCVIVALNLEEWAAGGSRFVTSIECISKGFVIRKKLKFRSEERLVGKECIPPCLCRW